jgi:Carboxypeptidase regulatory-like domain
MVKLYRQLALGGSSAVGASVAVLADLTQKNEASAMLKIAEVVGPPWLAALVVVVLAVAVCFIFECATPRRAFYTGASVLTILMATVPYKVPPSINTNPTKEAAVAPRQTSGLLGPSAAYAQTRTAAVPPVALRVNLTTADGQPVSRAMLTLRDPESDAIVARSNLSGAAFDLYPAPGRYSLVVEVPGYAITRREIDLRAGRPVRLDIRLEADAIPLPLQRLYRK